VFNLKVAPDVNLRPTMSRLDQSVDYGYVSARISSRPVSRPRTAVGLGDTSRKQTGVLVGGSLYTPQAI
jgi:hypothetical protein